MSVRWAGVARRDVVISSECEASERGDVRGGLAPRWADCVRWATHLAGGGGALGRAIDPSRGARGVTRAVWAWSGQPGRPGPSRSESERAVRESAEPCRPMPSRVRNPKGWWAGQKIEKDGRSCPNPFLLLVQSLMSCNNLELDLCCVFYLYV
jgi:hypothetical protein